MTLSELLKKQEDLIRLRRKFAYGSHNFKLCNDALLLLEDYMSTEIFANELEADKSFEDLRNELESLTQSLFGRYSS